MTATTAASSTSRPRVTHVVIIRVLVVVLLWCAWQWAPEQYWPSELVSRPPQIFAALWQMLIDGTLWTNTWLSLEVLLQATVLSLVLGVVAGGLVSRSRLVERSLNPIIGVANAIPKFALLPVFVGLFGLGSGPKMALLLVYMPFVYYYQAAEAMRSVDESMRNSLRLMGAAGVQIFRYASLPAAVSRVVTATRIAVPLGFLLVVFAEIWASSSGVGYLIAYNYSIAEVERAMAGVVWIFAIGLGLDSALRLLEQRVNRWRTS